MSDVILMYHRVCERSEALPWFARGTAVTPSAFEAQMRWLARHFEVVPMRELLSGVRPRTEGSSGRPRAALTFDDGYAEIASTALPICEALGMVGTVFPVCDHLHGRGRLLWFDAFYQLLQAACASVSPVESEPVVDGAPLSSWVRGPEKEGLQRAGPDERMSILQEIAVRFGLMSAPVTELYLSEDDLARLAGFGWGIGGHGVTHTRLTSLDEASLHDELVRAVSFARSFDPGEVVFAYPDGAHDERVRTMAAEVGVRWGLTVAPGRIDEAGQIDPLAVPRYLCRGEGDVPHPGLL